MKRDKEFSNSLIEQLQVEKERAIDEYEEEAKNKHE